MSIKQRIVTIEARIELNHHRYPGYPPSNFVFVVFFLFCVVLLCLFVFCLCVCLFIYFGHSICM